VDNRLGVTEAGSVKVESSDFRQAAYRFFEVLAHIGKAKATGIVRAFCSKQYPTVLLPKKGKLSTRMTWDVNRPNPPTIGITSPSLTSYSIATGSIPAP
jgi:hypothetical protein